MMTIKNAYKQRGLTLVEAIIAVSIMSMMAVFTLKSLGHSRLLRGYARDRAEMVLLAQTELDRVRRTETLEPGITTTSVDRDTTATATITASVHGLMQVEVLVERVRSEGRYATSLVALEGGRP